MIRTEGQISELSLKRPSIVIPSPVTSSLQVAGARRVGFLKLQSFNARAQQDLVASIHNLEKQNVTELVLDLRDNRGGLVQEGIEVAKVFLDGVLSSISPLLPKLLMLCEGSVVGTLTYDA